MTAIVAALAAIAPAAASAAPAPSCPTDGIVNPFVALGDTRDYVLAPGGAFESPDAGDWALSGDAKVVLGNEPFALNAVTDIRSLRLAPGALAVSPTFCVDLNYPTFRLPVRSLDAEGQADLIIEVRYPEGLDRSWKGVRTETGEADNGWRVTTDVDMKPETHSGTAGARLAQIRFGVKGKAGGPGRQLDSLFIDPRAL